MALFVSYTVVNTLCLEHGSHTTPLFSFRSPSIQQSLLPALESIIQLDDQVSRSIPSDPHILSSISTRFGHVQRIVIACLNPLSTKA
jgi:hypothetical protein